MVIFGEAPARLSPSASTRVRNTSVPGSPSVHGIEYPEAPLVNVTATVCQSPSLPSRWRYTGSPAPLPGVTVPVNVTDEPVGPVVALGVAVTADRTPSNRTAEWRLGVMVTFAR